MPGLSCDGKLLINSMPYDRWRVQSFDPNSRDRTVLFSCCPDNDLSSNRALLHPLSTTCIIDEQRVWFARIRLVNVQKGSLQTTYQALALYHSS